MFSNFHFLAGVAIVAGILTWGASGFAGIPETGQIDTPADLKLSAEDKRKSEALSNFAWGLYLQYQGRRSFKEIAPYYLRALALDPTNRELFELLITPWLMHREYDELIAGLGPIARANPDVTYLQLIYIEALKARKRSAEAATYLREILTRTKWQDPRILRELFVCLWREKNYDEIEALLKQARRKKALKNSFVVAHAEAIFYNARALTEQNGAKKEKRVAAWRKKALKAARKALELADQAKRLEDIQSLGQVFVALKDWQAVLELADKNERARNDPQLLLLKIKALEALNRTDKAIAVIDSMRRNGELHPMLLAEMARLYLKAGKAEQALGYLEQALSKAPRSIPIRLQLAFVYLKLDQPRKGVAVLVPLRILPPRGNLLLAHLYRAMANNAKAREALEAAEKEAEKVGDKEFLDADFHMFFATLCEELNQTDESIAQAEKARKLAPKDPMVANFLGYVLADHKRELPRAEKLIRQALEAEPDNIAYIDSLAWVYFRQRKFFPALQTIDRVLKKDGAHTDPVILDHAGDIYAANGLTILAREFWFAALDRGALQPDTIRAKIANGLNPDCD